MKYEETIGKSVALLVMGEDAHGEDDWSVVKGSITRLGHDLLFVHNGTPSQFPLPDDALDRIKATDAQTRSIMLDSDLYVPLTIGPKPEGPEGEGMLLTGLKWPEERQ